MLQATTAAGYEEFNMSNCSELIKMEQNVSIALCIYTSEREGLLRRSWRGSRDGSGRSMGFSGSTNWDFLNGKGFGDEGVVLHMIVARNRVFSR
jgi:hypothetical protein